MTDMNEKQGVSTVCEIASVIAKKRITPAELMSCGWLHNVFFDGNAPFLYRSNLRCQESLFWRRLLGALHSSGLFAKPIVFHENFGGWARIMRGRPRFIACDSLEEAISFMQRYSYYRKFAWRTGKRNDNYEILDPAHNIIIILTHHGAMYCFGAEFDTVMHLRRALRKVGLKSTVEDNCRQNAK